MRNKKLKGVFLALSIISLSIVLAVIPTIYSINKADLGLWTSYMHKEKKLIEKDFYKSNVFEFRVLRPITYWMGESVKNINDDIDDYINRNIYYEDVIVEEARSDGGVNSYTKPKEIKPTKEEAKNKLQKNVNYSKRRLDGLKNIKFMVINTKDNSYYTNTSYKNENEYKKNINDHINITLYKDFNNNIYEYTKQLDSKKSSKSGYITETKLLNSTQQRNLKIYMSFPKKISKLDSIYNYYQSYIYDMKLAQFYIILAIVSFIVFVISTVIYKSMKIEFINKNGKLLNLLRKIPLDILLGFMLIDSMYYLSFSKSHYYGYSYTTEKICAILGAFLLLLSLFIIFKIYCSYNKKTDIFKQTLFYKLYFISQKQLINILKLFKKIPLIKFIVLAAFVCTSISLVIGYILYHILYNLVFVITPFIAVGMFTLYIVKKLSYLEDIIEGTQKIKNGDLHYKIDVKGYNNFTKLAENINNIGEGLEKSIENQLRSERMKSELITNVSHDLKTPLTSIINYIELIKKEENIEPKYLIEYVNVLDSKSKRLKVLIEDLFEASKASSGNIELNMENIEIGQLLIQSIGEMEEKLSDSNLDIKIKIPDEKKYIYADGRRMYRVFENLLSNIAKYSLPNTRVYIDLEEFDNNIKLTMKNISSYELNFDVSEITERFKRADESRNTEGSGLGLAISKDLVKIQGGKFDIEIDGDLFKVILEFNKVEK